MKNLILLLSLVFIGCSKDDADLPVQETNEVVVYEYYCKDVNPELISSRYNFTATVNNNSGKEISGKVVFLINNGNSKLYSYIDGYVVNANNTQTKTQLGIIYFNSTPAIESVYFESK